MSAFLEPEVGTKARTPKFNTWKYKHFSIKTNFLYDLVLKFSWVFEYRQRGGKKSWPKIVFLQIENFCENSILT